MKSFIVLAVLVAVAVARPGPAGSDADAIIVRSDFDNTGIDGYNFSYETSNGIANSEQGQLQNAGTEDEYITVRGQFSYTAPDGQLIKVVYEAGPEGFKAVGDHIPS